MSVYACHLQADRSMRCGDGRRADTVCRERLWSSEKIVRVDGR